MALPSENRINAWVFELTSDTWNVMQVLQCIAHNCLSENPRVHTQGHHWKVKSPKGRLLNAIAQACGLQSRKMRRRKKTDSCLFPCESRRDRPSAFRFELFQLSFAEAVFRGPDPKQITLTRILFSEGGSLRSSVDAREVQHSRKESGKTRNEEKRLYF